MVSFERINPILCVSDVDASIAYYVSKLGFDHGFTWGEPTSFGSVVRDGLEVMFCRDGQGSPGTWFTIWVDDVDGHRIRFSVSTDRHAPENPTPFGPS